MMDLSDAEFEALPVEVRTSTAAGFAREFFGFKAYPYQVEVMDALLHGGARRVVWVAGRRVGKTETMANVALVRAVWLPGSQTAIFAPTVRQAQNLLGRIKFYLQGSAFETNASVNNDTRLRLRFGTDARGKHVESSITINSLGAQVRGEGADMLIVDESDYCDSEDYRNKALPFIADRPDAVLVHISTVARPDGHFAEALKQFEKLPQGRRFETPTRLKPGVTEERMQEYARTMLRSEYLREYECILVPESGVFPRQALAACLSDYEVPDIEGLEKAPVKRHHAYYVGVDWAKMKDQSVIAVVEHGTQQRVNPARLVFLQVYKPDPTGDRHYAKIIRDVLRVAKHYDAARVVADASAQDAGEQLKRELGRKFEPYMFTVPSRDKLVDNAARLVENRALQLPMEPEEVRQAFANVQVGEEGYSHASRATKDLFDAIALALSKASTAGEPERRTGRQLHAVGPGSAPIGLGGYGKMGKVVEDPLYWASSEMRRYMR
jgi:hypothetical protein